MSDVIQELDQQIATLQRQKQELLDKQKLEKLREVKAIIAQFGFTSTDLGLQSSKKKPVKLPAKYLNPDNPNESWHGGRGAKPKWVKAYLASGRSLDAIEIKN